MSIFIEKYPYFQDLSSLEIRKMQKKIIRKDILIMYIYNYKGIFTQIMQSCDKR